MSDAAYREVVPAFYTGLAALQTSQEVLARAKFDHTTALVPDEAAGWANLGLLLLRQQEIDAGLQKLQKAALLAPKSGAIQRLLALAQGRKGDLAASIGHWRSALALDPGDAKAAFGLAQEIERQGGAANEAEAQRVLEALLARGENLAVRLELARLSAKRGDGAALQKALAPLAEASQAWPEPAKEQLAALQNAAGSPRGAAPLVAFLKNVLVREPEYRRAVAAVSTPRDEVGEPLLRFVNLDNPEPQPAPPDVALAFAVEALPGPRAGWVGAVSLSGEGPPAVVAADAKTVARLGSAAGAPQLLGGFPGGAGAEPPSPDGVLAADLDYDYRTDLVLAGAGGLRFLRQGEDGRFTDVTAAAKLPPALVWSPAHGAWAADFDTDGDLDVVLAPRNAPPLVLRNNGDGTFAERRPFTGARAIRGFAWADLDGEGVPDAVLLEADGLVRV
ncbi:MAG TPA: FG-GAP-like repeat-containing protein, partial [Vicinamibacteria bacterium]|nr:FG-GAP-like repeat-containing protein [Vicinamibacteria bacterium]